MIVDFMIELQPSIINNQKSTIKNAPGVVAHLGERFNGIEEVEGSNPFDSTKK
jgi:hypothetical protein